MNYCRTYEECLNAESYSNISKMIKQERKKIFELLGVRYFSGRLDYFNEEKLQECHDNGIDIETVYCDRMWQWDMEKYDDCCMKVWHNTGQIFKERCKHPEDIQNFLSLYFEKDCELLAVITTTNQSTGYPISCFFYTCKE